MSKKSNIWEFFERTDANHAKCNECNKELVSKSGTKFCLLNHFKGQHTQPFLAYEKLNDRQNVLPRGHVSDNYSSDHEFISSAKRARVVATSGSYPQLLHHLPLLILEYQKLQKHRMSPYAAKPLPKDHIENVKLVTEVTKWVITDNLPFSMVDSKAFLSIMKQETKGKHNPVFF